MCPGRSDQCHLLVVNITISCHLLSINISRSAWLLDVCMALQEYKCHWIRSKHVAPSQRHELSGVVNL